VIPNRLSPESDESPMPVVIGPISVGQLAVIESRLPTWATTTTIYRDADGKIVGYGSANRATGEFTVEADPSAVRLLSASPR